MQVERSCSPTFITCETVPVELKLGVSCRTFRGIGPTDVVCVAIQQDHNRRLVSCGSYERLRWLRNLGSLSTGGQSEQCLPQLMLNEGTHGTRTRRHSSLPPSEEVVEDTHSDPQPVVTSHVEAEGEQRM